MKRHPALVTLSRDHQHALAVALGLRRATPDTAPAATAAFLEFWRAEGAPHFRVEEETLLPAYAEHGDPGHEAVVRMLVDHVAIRRDAALVERGAPLEALHAVGERLAAHVRLEEHEVFPLIEETLPEPELDALGARLRDLDMA